MERTLRSHITATTSTPTNDGADPRAHASKRNQPMGDRLACALRPPSPQRESGANEVNPTPYCGRNQGQSPDPRGPAKRMTYPRVAGVSVRRFDRAERELQALQASKTHLSPAAGMLALSSGNWEENKEITRDR